MEADVLIAAADPAVRAAAARWCAAIGATVHESADLNATRKAWRSAQLVLLGQDLAHAVAADAGCPRRDRLHLVVDDASQWWEVAVKLGAVDVFEIADEQKALRGISAAIDRQHEGCSIVITGAGGGVGCSTFAVATALEAARRQLRPVLLDADTGGAGIELIAGAEAAEGLRWTSLVDAGGRVAPTSLASALPIRSGVATVGWGPTQPRAQLPEAAVDVWAATVRAFDLVVIDQPNMSGHHTWDSAVLGGSVLTALLVPDDIAGLGAARRRLATFETVTASVAAIVVRRRGGLGPSAVEDNLGIPVVSTMKRDRRLQTAVDQGRGPGRSRTLRHAAREVLDLIGLDRPMEG